MSHYHSSSTRCAACKCLRRKCPADCILSPYFPSSNPQRFASVHKVFGAANITKMLEQVPMHLRGQAAECMIFEAATRTRDPIYGSVGIISQLQQQITQVQNEIMKIRGEIALQSAQQQHNQTQTTLRMEQLSDQSGLDVGPDIGLGLDVDTGPSSGADAGSSSGRHYEMDLDEFYAKFNHQP
uniref:LOB domain-containing protein n=1 Tax=Kalanchoe fedtschenkoi TaxID=63787 RepID=A0A7N0TS15_KALFE